MISVIPGSAPMDDKRKPLRQDRKLSLGAALTTKFQKPSGRTQPRACKAAIDAAIATGQNNHGAGQLGCVRGGWCR